MNSIPKQDTVKLHAIALLSIMTNANVTVLLLVLLLQHTRNGCTKLIDFLAPL